ncbi:MAG TPA: NAD(P)/FAD-dependent oxidoreductase [Thermoleophilaceae bacterium]|nr:NAD(P)/FAD-dependent oxidoreductase [Thermoleophilaceae bacterium]
MSTDYDAIVIGARCGGSPTAMLLARNGYRVLLVDKATFPSDTMSTHLAHPPAVDALDRWGILEALEATNCPPITHYSFNFGPVSVAGTPRPANGGAAKAYCPRRIILDALLVEAAAAAGAEVREAFTVEEVVMEDGRVTGIRGHAKGGDSVTETAKVVIGADGRHSIVAKAVQPEQYNEVPPLAPAYYAYWSGLPADGFDTYIRAERGRGWAAIPTHDGLTCVVQGTPQADFATTKKDVEGTYLEGFELAPEFAERIKGATRESGFMGAGDLAGYFRKPYGPGWALVGDAGYHKHPITAFGITDAFRDAEAVATALDETFSERRSFDDAMADYQRARDEEAMPIYGFTCDFAKLEPPPPEMQQLIGAMQGNQDAQDGFVSVMAGTLPAPEFFGPENAGRIMAAAGAPSA